jgi:hypothetical protein
MAGSVLLLLLLLLVLEGSELLLTLAGSSLLLTLELLELDSLGSGFVALSVMVGSSGDEKPKTGTNTPLLKALQGPMSAIPGVCAMAGITKAAANTTTKTPTMIIRRTVSSFVGNT